MRTPQSAKSSHSPYRGYPKLEIFGGYNLQKAGGYPTDDFPTDWGKFGLESGYTTTGSHYLKKGFAGSFTYNFTPRLGLETAVQYNVGDMLGVSESEFSYAEDYLLAGRFKREDLSFLFGPHFVFRTDSRLTSFVHALAGYSMDEFSLDGELSVNGEFISDRIEIRTSKSVGALVGGGWDLSINTNWAVRLAQADYYISKHGDPRTEGFDFTDFRETLYFPGEKELFKNIALSFGIVFKL